MKMGYIFLIAAIGLFGLAIKTLVGSIELDAKGVGVEGEISRVIVEKDDKGTKYRPVVKFVAKDGKEIEFISTTASNPPSYNKGEKVAVKYIEDDPQNARIDDFSSFYFLPIVLLVFGTFFTGVAMIDLSRYIWRFRVRKALEKNGIVIQAEVNEVLYDSFQTHNGKSPWFINAQWFDRSTNKMFVFQSEKIWFDPSEFVGSQVSVKVDQTNPENYEMDLSFLPKKA